MNLTDDKLITDGFDNYWSKRCPTCGQDSIEIVRPGEVQCNAETGYCSWPFCSKCGSRHEGECA